MNASICQLILAIAWFPLFVSCRCDRPPEPLPAPVITTLNQLTERAYAHKRNGQNAAALAELDRAQHLLHQKAATQSVEHASISDDQASIHLRMGDYQRAQQLYSAAQSLLDELNATTEAAQRLKMGIAERIRLLHELQRLGIRCREPAAYKGEPDGGSHIPYFPNIKTVQVELGRLNPAVASCIDGIPRPIMLQLLITGDGQIRLAKVAPAHRDEPNIDCIERALIDAAAKADIPRFGACYRVFHFPFQVGR